MRVSNYIRQMLIDRLIDHRIVVWYDSEQAFGDFVANFTAPNCQVISAQESRLLARRQAETIYRQLNNTSVVPTKARANLLIYLPFARSEGEEARRDDPFEVFAVAGTTFGHQESEKLASLAHQALPSDLSDQIERLFREGKPALTMLDNLERGATYPLVKQILDSQSAVDVAMQLLSDPQCWPQVEQLPGCQPELLRLLATELGFNLPPDSQGAAEHRLHLARYILFSEFVFDLPVQLPPALSNLSQADIDYRNRIYAIAERWRDSLAHRDSYLDLAAQVEETLKLPSFFVGTTQLGRRDTFAFEEQQYLMALVQVLNNNQLETACQIIQERRHSVWRAQPERSQIWKVAERCVTFLEVAAQVESNWKTHTQSVATMVSAYTQAGGWSDLDRHQRLMEQSIAECTESETLETVIARCRTTYRQLITSFQKRFLVKIEADGWPPDSVLRQSQIFNRFVAPALANRERVAYFITDSLRFEMGRDLSQTLETLGEVQLQPAAAALPTITPVGMAALLPDADGTLSLRHLGQDLVPYLGQHPLKRLDDRERLLAEKFGDRVVVLEISQFLSLSSTAKREAALKEADLAVIRDSRIDNFGENITLREVRKYMTDLLGDIKAAAAQLVRLGYNYIVIATDHGHVLLPDIPAGDVIADSPPGEWLLTKRRSLLGQKVSERAGSQIFKATHVGIQGDATEFVVPQGFGVYSRGSGYFHGGLSLLEAVLPVITLRARSRPAEQGADDLEIRYRSDKFTSRVIGLKIWFNSLVTPEIRTKIEAFAGSAPNAPRVGEAAECDARDEITHEVTLVAGQETAVPVLLDPDFEEDEIEIRATDPETPVVWYRLTLKNDIMS